MAGFPIYRPRRLRATENLRSMIRETSLSVKDLIFPLFVVPGSNVKNEIETLKNNYQWSVDRVMEAVDEAVAAGIPAVLLFGLPSYKDEEGSSAWDDNEPVQMASKAIKAPRVSPPHFAMTSCSAFSYRSSCCLQSVMIVPSRFA